MKVYKFKCESCGATEYQKLDNHTYACKYCGCREEVHTNTEASTNQVLKEKKANKLKAIEYDGKISNVVVHLIICCCLGPFGVHRFMERKIFTGIIFLFSFGFLGFGILYDSIKYISKIVHLYKMKQYHLEETGEAEEVLKTND